MIFRYIRSGSAANLFVLFIQSFAGAFVVLWLVNDSGVEKEIFYSFVFLSVIFPAVVLFSDLVTGKSTYVKQNSPYKFHHYLNKQVELDINDAIAPYSPNDIIIHDRKRHGALSGVYRKIKTPVTPEEIANAAYAYEMLLSLNKKNPLLHFNYGCVLYMKSEFNKAFNVFLRTNALLKVLPMKKSRRQRLLTASYYNAGNCMFKSQRIREALYCYRKALSVDPENLKAKENLVITHFAGTDPKEAIRLYDKLVDEKNMPFLFNLHLFMSGIYIKKNDYEKALEALVLAESIKKDVTVMHSIADLLYNMDRSREAAEKYEEILKTDSTDEAALLGLGTSYMKLNENEAAAAAFRLISHNKEAAYNLAYIYYKTGDNAQALKYLDESAEGSDPRALKLAGSIYMKAGRYYEAIKSYRAALEDEPGNYKILFNLGLAHAKIKDYHTARKYFENACISKRNDPDIIINLIKVLNKMNDPETAKKYALENKDILITDEAGREQLKNLSLL